MVYCAGKRTENLKLFYKSIRPNEAFRESHYKDFKPEIPLVKSLAPRVVRLGFEWKLVLIVLFFHFFFFAVIRSKQLNMNMLKQQQ